MKLGTTEKYWAIANFNIVLIGVFAILFGIVLLITSITKDEKIAIAVCLPGFVAVGSISFKDKSFIFNALLEIFIAYCLITAFSQGGYIYPIVAMLVSYACGLIVAVPLAKCTEANFSEIVSRRMRWRNSNVDLFDMKMKYVINRYCVFAFCISSIVFFCLLLPYCLLYPDFYYMFESYE